jgi:hypothetical protein
MSERELKRAMFATRDDPPKRPKLGRHNASHQFSASLALVQMSGRKGNNRMSDSTPTLPARTHSVLLRRAVRAKRGQRERSVSGVWVHPARYHESTQHKQDFMLDITGSELIIGRNHLRRPATIHEPTTSTRILTNLASISRHQVVVRVMRRGEIDNSLVSDIGNATCGVRVEARGFNSVCVIFPPLPLPAPIPLGGLVRGKSFATATSLEDSNKQMRTSRDSCIGHFHNSTALNFTICSSVASRLLFLSRGESAIVFPGTVIELDGFKRRLPRKYVVGKFDT